MILRIFMRITTATLDSVCIHGEHGYRHVQRKVCIYVAVVIRRVPT